MEIEEVCITLIKNENTPLIFQNKSITGCPSSKNLKRIIDRFCKKKKMHSNQSFQSLHTKQPTEYNINHSFK